MVHFKPGFGNVGNTGGTGNVGGVNNDAAVNPQTNPVTLGQPDSTKIGGLVSTATSMPTSVPGEVIKKLSQVESGKTVDLISKPTRITSTTVEFRLSGSEGRLLKPGEQIYMEIPPQFRGRKLASALFAHRQQQSDKSSVKEGKWDNTPGTTALHFHSTTQGSEGFRYWNAPWGSSGGEGAKYAELRSGGDPEVEREFEFFKQGTTGVKGGGHSKAPLEIDALRLRSNGTDPTRVHLVQVTFMPDKPDHTNELIFSPGTNLGDPYTAAGRSYGKDTSKGTYPGALPLGGWGGGSDATIKAKLDSKGWKMDGSQLSIPLEAGKKFTGVEVSCGDTHPDGKSNSDGEMGTQGYSRISMGIQRAGTNSVDWFTQGEGVPPQGVIFGGPNQENFVAKPGDKLIISASSDTTYVMGVRTWHND